jgi:hypothetical protein
MSLLLLVFFPGGGCVQRTMTIESDPPGALVELNGQEIGRTPLTQDFLWYGRYDVHLRLDGHQTIKTTANVRSPLWQIPPIDLLAELMPMRLHDHQRFYYQLTPTSPDTEDPASLVQRAENLRRAAEVGR